MKAKAVEWQRSNPELKREYDKRTLANNPERRAKGLANLRAYNAAHPEEHRERCKRWKRNNPEINSVNNARRAVKQYGSKGRGVNFRQWKEILAVWDWKCAYCGEPYGEMEHVVTLSRGGLHDRANVVPSCRGCNATKYKMTLARFIDWRPVTRERMTHILTYLEGQRGDAFPLETAGYVLADVPELRALLSCSSAQS